MNYCFCAILQELLDFATQLYLSFTVIFSSCPLLWSYILPLNAFFWILLWNFIFFGFSYPAILT